MTGELKVQKQLLQDIQRTLGLAHTYMVNVDHAECTRNQLPAASSPLGTKLYEALRAIGEVLK